VSISERAPSNGVVAAAGFDEPADYAGLLVDRLAAAIIDDSLPLKEVERDLRGSVAEVAIRKRGLDKRETANRCGVTEKSIENYLKETRNNPKSPEREVARALQDEMLSLEEVYDTVSPILSPTRNFTLDDVKRALEKLIRTGEVQEYPGHKYRAVERPAIRYPATVEGHRELVDQKARDLDYIVLRQKEAGDEDLARRDQRYSRVVGDSNLVRIDFTVDVSEEDLPQFYEKLSGAIAKLTMKEEKKKGKSRVRLLLGMRSVATVAPAIVAFAMLTWLTCSLLPSGLTSWVIAADRGAGEDGRSWELDNRPDTEDQDEDDPAADEEDIGGEGGSLDDPDSETGGVGVAPDEDDEDFALADEDSPMQPMRGDVNFDDRIDVADPFFLINYVQLGGVAPPCVAAADVDGNRLLQLQDALLLLRHLYLGEDLGGGQAQIASPERDEFGQGGGAQDPVPLDCEAAVGV
jgi:hypothetical protein